uniref:uncharacterized protein n=1 Tax=Myxine glutinosa TaxID=7769 RepID=UPI00358E7549
MEKYLRPERFEANPNSSNAAKEWNHWYKTFDNFLRAIEHHEPEKLTMLVNYVAPSVYEYIAVCEDYDTAIETLRNMYVRPKNEVYARHLLASHRQQPGETLDEFLQALKCLSGDCNCKAVTPEKYKEESIRDAFISGLQSHVIRQRLLENKTLDLTTAFDQARALDQAQRCSEAYTAPVTPLNAVITSSVDKPLAEAEIRTYRPTPPDVSQVVAASGKQPKCFFSGSSRHTRQVCPVPDSVCNKCGKTGHFAKVCRSSGLRAAAMLHTPTLATIYTAFLGNLSQATVNVLVNGNKCRALLDTGSSESFVCQRLVKAYKLCVHPGTGRVSMASSSLSTRIAGHCLVNLELKGCTYRDVRLSILPDRCSDVILGQDFMKHHECYCAVWGR